MSSDLTERLVSGDVDAKNEPDTSNKRRKTLDAFFSPQVTTRPASKDGKAPYEVVALNAEQIRVLDMVVKEGKNVFFTGAAGQHLTSYIVKVMCNRTSS